jgi:hypothetical protein
MESEETTVDVKRLGKQILAETITRAKTEELLASAFSVRSVMYQILNIQLKENRELILSRTSCYSL